MITIDGDKVIVREKDQKEKEYSIGSPEAFKIISDIWLRTGWDNKHVYSFTWMGRPIIQLPEDMVRVQELIFQIKPDVILETGVAHGGSSVFYASLCKAMDKGRVIGVDVEIRPHNRKAIEEHFLFPLITLIEGSSVDPNIFKQVESLIKPNDIVFVMLDSNHKKDHVLKELELYSKFVSKGSYIIAADGIMQCLKGAPRTTEDWDWNNPRQAAIEFVSKNKNFVIKEPEFLFNEGTVESAVTYWQGGWIKRIN